MSKLMTQGTRFVLTAMIGLIVWAVAVPAAALTDAEVERKINELKLYLYRLQDKQTGGWYDSKYHKGPEQDHEPEKNKNLGGPTALATLALLVSGESSQDPRLAKAIDYLRGLDMYGTYALSLKVHVWSYLPDRYLDNLASDAKLFLDGIQPNNTFGYYVGYEYYDQESSLKKSKVYDNSTTQYGGLALWQAAKRGVSISPKFWAGTAEHFFKIQNDDGGWGYAALPEKKQTRLTMTCAGLTCLYIVQQELFRNDNKPPQRILESINRAMEYLDQEYTASSHAHGGDGYYRYGVERVALASGVKYLNGQDWFETTGGHIVKQDEGNSLVNASFDLMFLARGRVPVWVNKIKLKQGNWNNRPNDMYFTSRHLSRLGEHEVNWQFVELDRPVFDYLPAPAAWLSSDNEVELTEAEKAGLKKYLDLGGMLIANGEGSAGFEESIQRLAREFYPHAKWVQVDADHPMGNLILNTDTRGDLPVKSLTNGVRDLILIPNRDWGLTLQKEEDLTKVLPGQLMTNLYAMVSGRGNLPNRLVREFPIDSGNRAQPPAVWVAQAKLGPEDTLGNPEPEAWRALANRLGADASLNLRWAEAPLAELGDGTIEVNEEQQTVSVLHLAGGAFEADYELTEDEKQAIKSFVEAGGTVLVEGVGGRSEFAENIAQQLTPVFGAAASRLTSVDPVMTGSAGVAGKSVSRVNYRRFSVIHMEIGQRPRLSAINHDGRAAVIVSSEDLSLGALGVRHWGINGYQTESARQILTNIILAAKR